MSETGFRIFNGAFSLGAELLYAVFFSLFLRPFMAERGGRRRGPAIVFASCLFVNLLCSGITAPQGMFSLMLIALLTAISKPLQLDRATAFLLGLLYWNAKISSGLMAESLYFASERRLPALTGPPEAVYFRSAVLLTLLLLSHAALFAALLCAFQRQMGKRRLSLHRLELCYLSLVPAAGILFGQMISQLFFEAKDGQLLQLYDRHPAFLAAVPLLALLFCAGAYLAIAFQQGMAALQEKQANDLWERQQIQAIRAHIQEAEQFYTHIRQMRHEMRGHLTNIRGLAQSGAYASLKDYIARMEGTMRDFTLALQTGNPVTDVIVNGKRRQSLDAGICFQADFHYPGAGVYDAFDIGIILQNLLQNALEACEKVPAGQRFITLTGRQSGRFFLIEVKNPFVGEVVLGQDGLPLTAKKQDIPMHGIGLSNVRRTALKHMGEMEISLEQQVFGVTVMVQETSST